ncbi:gamma-interferon-inducible protein 16 [Aotus nancymaae]|uniref:gamma-interferon-inducible protein 16 n=1 Tax=Aotus nancymaae TaxID=37293 RepID=UPI0030FF1E86
MGKKYKNIVLLKGLEGINDYHFRMVKSLLSSDLKLNPKMREEYDKIQIADLLEEKFPGDAGLGKLIQILKQIPTLGDFAETLKKEKLKAQGQTPSKKRKQETDPAVPAPSAVSITAEGAEATPGDQKRKISTKKKTETKKSKMSEEQTQPPCPAGASMFTAVGHSPPPQPSSSAPPDAFSIESPKPVAKRPVTAKRNIPQKGPVIVKVLSATKPFGYETPENEKKMMFHATVVTPTQFFHVKVLNINLKEKFSGKKIITISDYLEYDNLLEVNEGSSVSEAGPDQKLEVPNKIISRAKETLKIDILHKQASGNIVYGIFTLLKKEVNQKQKSTTYEIEDDRGKMDVVGTGQCHDIPCEDGDKLHLFCFRLRKKNQMSKLISEMHSFIEVKKKTNPRNYAPKSMKLPQEQSQLLNTSEASTTLPESHPQTPQMPPITASGSSVIKESEDPFPKINEFWRMHKETWQFPGPSMTSRGPAGSHPQTPQMSASTPSSSFFTTVVKKENKKDALNPDSYMKTSNSFF